MNKYKATCPKSTIIPPAPRPYCAPGEQTVKRHQNLLLTQTGFHTDGREQVFLGHSKCKHGICYRGGNRWDLYSSNLTSFRVSSI